MASNADRLVRSTVMVEAVKGGQTIGTGSGLLMHLRPFGEADTRFVPAVVTNKHVVEGADEVRYRLAGKSVPVISTSPASSIVMHPDLDVDLCIIPVANDALRQGVHLNEFISSTDIISGSRLSELTAIEPILMIGYPSGLIDQKGLFPMARRGITATPAAEDFDGNPDFAIDCACFPGSSGSPVFLFDPFGFVAKNNDVHLGEMRFGLLGFLYSGPVMTQAGEIVAAPPPKKLNLMVEVPLMLNLGFCVRAEKLEGIYPALQMLPEQI